MGKSGLKTLFKGMLCPSCCTIDVSQLTEPRCVDGDCAMGDTCLDYLSTPPASGYASDYYGREGNYDRQVCVRRGPGDLTLNLQRVLRSRGRNAVPLLATRSDYPQTTTGVMTKHRGWFAKENTLGPVDAVDSCIY
jgi:hypothetical protein